MREREDVSVRSRGDGIAFPGRNFRPLSCAQKRSPGGRTLSLCRFFFAVAASTTPGTRGASNRNLPPTRQEAERTKRSRLGPLGRMQPHGVTRAGDVSQSSAPSADILASLHTRPRTGRKCFAYVCPCIKRHPWIFLKPSSSYLSVEVWGLTRSSSAAPRRPRDPFSWRPPIFPTFISSADHTPFSPPPVQTPQRATRTSPAPFASEHREQQR